MVARLALAHLRAADERRQQRRSSCTTRRPRKLHQATSGYLNDTQPVFDPEGKYLFYASDRAFDPVYGSFDNTLDLPEPDAARGRAAAPATSSRRSPRATTPRTRRSIRTPKDKDGEATDRSLRKRSRTSKKPDDKKPTTARRRTRSPRRSRRREEDDEALAPANVDIDLDGFEARAVVLPPKARQLRRPAGGQGQAALSAAAAHRLGRREERRSSTSISQEREEKTVLDDADGVRGRRPTARRCSSCSKKKFAIVDIKAAQKFEKPMVTARHRGAGRSARRMAADVHGRLPLRARLLLRPEHARRELGRDARALQQAARRRGDAVGRELRDRRVHRRAERLAHVSRRRRQEQAPQRSVGMLGVDWELANGAYRIKRIVRGGPWDAACARRSTSRASTSRKANTCWRSTACRSTRRRIRGRAFQGLGDKTVVLTVNSVAVDDRRAAGRREVPDERDRAALPRVDRGAAPDRRQGDQREDRLHLRAEHRRRRAERADPAIHGAVEEGWAHHRRAVEQRRPDSRSLHRAAQPADPRVLGGARRRRASSGRRWRIAVRRSC